MKEIIENIAKVCEEVSKKNNGGNKNLIYAYGMFLSIMKGIPEDKPKVYLEQQLRDWEVKILKPK